MPQILFFAYFSPISQCRPATILELPPNGLEKKAHVCGKVRGENLGWDMLRFQGLNQHLDLTNKHVFFQTQLNWS